MVSSNFTNSETEQDQTTKVCPGFGVLITQQRLLRYT
jgi:hypothetical protein